METIELAAKKREPKGKSGARALRRQGELPAVLYGEDGGAQHISLDSRTLEKIISSPHGEQAVLSLKIEGADQLAMIKDVQSDVISRKPIHLDLLRISLDKTVEVRVPIKLINAEAVKKKGGIVQQNVTELTVECLPLNIPEQIVLDLAKSEVGNAICVEDIAVSEAFTIINDADEVLVSIVAPAKLEDEKPVAAEGEGEAAQPEVIKKESKDKEKEKGGKDKEKEKGGKDK